MLSSWSAQDGAGARRRRRLLNAGAAGAAGARRLAAGDPGSVAGSERAAASAGAVREGVLPSARGAGSEAVEPAGASGEPVVSATRGASWEAISVSEAGSSAASAPRGADAKAVAAACLACSCPSCATTGPQTVPARGPGANPVTTTCHAASARATAGSDAAAALVVAGAKAVTVTCHTGPTAATGSETVSITGFTKDTAPAAAFVELHAVDVLDIGPALAQLLRAVLPGRGAGGERCGQVGLHPGPLHPWQAS